MSDAAEAQGWLTEDFTANRQGMLSERQRQLLSTRLRRYTLTRGLVIVLPQIIAVGIFVTILVLGHTYAGVVLPVMFAIVELPLLVFVGLRVMNFRNDLATGTVAKVVGSCAGSFGGYRTGEAYVRVGQVRMVTFAPDSEGNWQAPHRFLRDLGPSVVVVAYYLPRTRLIVAAERASEQNP